jgi:3-methyladenine DNA glycosylase AlkD
MIAQNVIDGLVKYASAKDAEFLQRYFKTGVGQYGDGDVFIGVRASNLRQICKQFVQLPLKEVQKLFVSNIHEHRQAAAIILTYKYPKADEAGKQAIYDLYMMNVLGGRVNNWDIVDVSAPKLVGCHLLKRPRDVLFKLAISKNVWSRRVAIMSTFQFIRSGDAETALQISEILVDDNHDLIQKAVGWMLREIGKLVSQEKLEVFLEKHARTMPRTELRYAVEKLPKDRKDYYMALKSKVGVS